MPWTDTKIILEDVMKLIATALLSVSAFALVAPAASAQSERQYQSYQECEEAREGRQVTGAIIGGILGAIIGNEIADDSNNNRHGASHRRGRGHGYGRHHRRRYEHRDRGNAEEVGTIAGAGVGAVIGAGVAGGGECDQYRARQNDPRYLDKPPAYDQQGYQQQGSYTDSYYVEDGQGYSTSNVDLVGGNSSTSRTYNASSSDWNCEWTNSSRQDSYGQITTEQVYMCEGSDGIWRPYDTYVSN
jgi:hypothetical protein